MSLANNYPFDQSYLDDDLEKEDSIYFLLYPQLSMNDYIKEANEFHSESFRHIIEIGEEEKHSTEISSPLFITSYFNSRNKQRGRKVASEVKCSIKRRHLSTSEDNILSKIQVHFSKFIIYFLNDCLLDYYKTNEICFKKLAHKVISKASSVHFNKIKNSTIYEILKEIPISKKYKNVKKDINKKIAEDLNQIDWFNKLLGLKFMELFYFYYNERKQLKKIFLFAREITLSNDTKSYYFLLEKYKKEKKDIILITENNYHFDNIDKEKIRAYSEFDY